MIIYSRHNNKHMKQTISKIGAALLIMWAFGMSVIIIIGASADGPIDGPELINAWTFYGFVLGVPTVAVALMRLGNK